ncbi:PREDICTED: WD repeat-containing protein 44-like [Camelina sativa]|uniref:WD repeat-containing protein 44-like n=1 Tax=Camelina sativa TaxID=90675 RepID=A0ABM0WNN4_CAMSA|nr:PREDICTED: WD repeat-containing protein 44-like [Camelina sativa]
MGSSTRGDAQVEDDGRFFDAIQDEEQDSSAFHLWTTTTPDSVSNRRRKFLQSMGFSFNKTSPDDDDSQDDDDLQPPPQPDLNEVVTHVVDLLVRNESTASSSLFDISSSVSSSSQDTDDHTSLARNVSSSSSIPRGLLSESSSSKSGSFGDFHDTRTDDLLKRGAKSWLKKLGVLAHVFESLDCESVRSPLHQVARVHTHKKQFKELSSLSVDQDFSAHDGSILAMKFSPDGKYIASAGEDCVVRVWSVSEKDRTDNKYQVAEADSGVYFAMNQHSQIEPLKINNDITEKKTTTSFLRKSSDSTCVVLPPTVFTISETPLYEFRGHIGEILDLSWSDKGYLLSSSVDETVRLWRVGSDECLSTFTHNNFVTCVAFNPVDDNYFISGSIDGKVRIWDVSRSRVVDYTDIRDIVTAVCYRPDAKGAVIGSMTGNCRFYHIFDNQLEMDKKINIHGKKKVASKRITGLQFLPSDSEKVMVTSADSQIRILCGEDVICKLKASSLRTTSASFISDGKHIVSTSEDSCIHVWNYSQLPSKKPSSGTKRTRSYEGFLSHNVSVAIPWLRQGHRDELSECIIDLDRKLPKVDCFSPMKGSTTWPEEKLEDAAMSNRGKLKLLRSAWQPHLWGLVFVTATWDGRIRVFNNYGLPIRV